MSMIKHYQISAESELKSMPFEEGSLYFTEDTKRIYLDPVGGSSRILVNGDPIILANETERQNLLAPLYGKIYFVLESSNIYIYQDGVWHSYVETDTTLTISGKSADAKATGDKINNLQMTLNNKATNSVYNCTLTASGWGTTFPYTQTVTVSGILNTDVPIADIDLSDESLDAVEVINAWSSVARIKTDSDSITAYCYSDKPTLNIPIILKVIR